MRTLLAAGLLALSARLLLAAPQALTPSATAVPVVLAFKASGTVHGPNVLLKDLIEGEVAEPLASMAIKAAGRPGATLTVARALVQLRLKSVKGAPRIEGPDVCALSVPVQKIPGTDLQRFANGYLAAQLSGTAGVSVEARGVPADLSTFDASTRLNIQSPPQELRGNVVVRVQVLQPGAGGEDHEVSSVPVSFVIHRKEARVYAKRVFRLGDNLDAAGLTLRDEDTTYSQAQGFGSLEEVAGKRAKAYIASGKLVAADLVELPPLIKRGDIVRVIVKSGAVVVETSGRAMRDARLGETLPLELESTKKQMQARCVEAGVAVREAY